MRAMSTEELERHWTEPAGHKRAWPPITVALGVICSVAASVWINALEAPVNPSLTVELPQDGAWLLFEVAIIVGTLLGVRTFWALLIAFSAIGAAIPLASAIENPSAQSIGGLLFHVAAVVLLLLPSSARFEQRRVRVSLD